MSVTRADIVPEREQTSAPVRNSVIRHEGDDCERLSSQAQNLLTKVVISLAGEGPHLIRFLSLETVDNGRNIAQAFCQAAAKFFGSVLLTEFRLEGDSHVDRGNIVAPDAEVSRLFYGRLNASPLDIVRRGRLALLDGIQKEQGQYDMLVIDTRYDAGRTEMQTMSPIFATTILVAGAGCTSHRQIRKAYEIVHGAGGHVLGVALVAPTEPAWLRRLFPL